MILHHKHNITNSMGSSFSVTEEDDLRNEEFEELELSSGFSRDELRVLYKRFKTLDRGGTGTLGAEDLLRIPGMSFIEFARL